MESVTGCPSLEALKPVAKITGAYIGVWYVFIILQVAVKKHLLEQTKNDPKVKGFDIKHGNYKDKKLLTVNRTLGNTMEQMMPFLGSLWLCAIFGDVDAAVFGGRMYVLARAFYPLGFYMGAPYLLFSTGPGYASIVYMLSKVFM